MVLLLGTLACTTPAQPAGADVVADSATDVHASTKPCGNMCMATQYCNKTTNKCEDLPCGGPCVTAGDICRKSTNKCFTPCEGKCTGTQYCDMSAAATAADGNCKERAPLPTAWGISGDGKVQKIISLAIASSNDGCDINGDGKPDNNFNRIASLAGSGLSDSIISGQQVLLFEPTGYSSGGTLFTFNMLTGTVDQADAAHDPSTAGGKYTVQRTSYDPATGEPLVVFANAKATAGALTANAEKFFFNLRIEYNLPTPGINFALTISKPGVTGTVTDSTSWVDTKKGKVCGYITQDDLEGAINALPDWTGAGGGMSKVQWLNFLPGVLAPDLDMDGDGVKESISVALNLETASGIVTGVTPPKAP